MQDALTLNHPSFYAHRAGSTMTDDYDFIKSAISPLLLQVAARDGPMPWVSDRNLFPENIATCGHETRFA